MYEQTESVLGASESYVKYLFCLWTVLVTSIFCSGNCFIVTFACRNICIFIRIFGSVTT